MSDAGNGRNLSASRSIPQHGSVSKGTSSSLEVRKLSIIKTQRSTNSSSRRISTSGKKNVQIAQPEHEVKKRDFVIFIDGVNVTPKPLNPLKYERGKERQISSYDMTGSHQYSKTSTEQEALSTAHYSDFRLVSRREATFTQSNREDELICDPANLHSSSESVVMFTAKKQEKMPEYVTLTLKETSTEYIFELPSKTAEKDTDEGVDVEEENKRYDYLTMGKGRNRKVINAEIQTRPILLKTRETEKERVKKKSNYAFASGWDMFDTYADEVKVEVDEDEDIEFLVQKKSVDSMLMPDEEKQLQDLIKNPMFFEAVITVERLLANKNFNEEQKRFRGLSDPEPFREGIEYKYKLNLLWTFNYETTAGMCVTALSWNEENRDILAAGYGKFFFADVTDGKVLIWNIKNPMQPERVFVFHDAVTCLSFSTQNPNLLAIGFYYGSVQIIDISSRMEVRLIGETNRESFNTHDPIWQVTWISDDEYFQGVEQIIAMAQDGRVYKFRHTGNLNLAFSQMMRISNAGELKGIKTLRKCAAPGLPISNYPGALVYARHPGDPNIYFVGASTGVIHKCSKNFFHQHLDSFLAHDGPVKQAKFSPFCNKLLLTCGDDWYARIWLDSIWEPLIELKTNMQTTEGADWSPAHSTIIATIGGKDIYIWDLQRKAYSPQSVTTSPTNSRNTVVQFTSDGRCLVIGDIDGHIHIYSLEDMPFPAFFQANLLAQALKKALIIRPDLIREIKKFGDLNFHTEYTS